MSRRLQKIVSAFAVAATLLWGVTGIAALEHETSDTTVFSPNVEISAHSQGKAGVAVAPDSCDEDPTDSFDRCCPPGCSFSATTPIPFGEVVHGFAAAPVFALDSSALAHGVAPPLRPPRIS